MAKISIDMYLLTIAVIVSYIIIKIDPIKMIKNLFPSYTFYYRASDLRITKNNSSGSENTTNVTNGEDNFKKQIQDTKLYDSTSFTKVSGHGFYNNFILKTDNGTYDIEDAQFFINCNDSFNFTVASFSKNENPGYLKPGIYKFSINGGSGIFANSSGNIVFNVLSNGVRKVHVYL